MSDTGIGMGSSALHLEQHTQETINVRTTHANRLIFIARIQANLVIDQIMNSGAKFTSLSEPWADTTSPAGKMIMTVFAGMAEVERDLLRERTGVGRKDAIERGVRFGRPSKISADQKKLAQRLLREGQSI